MDRSRITEQTSSTVALRSDLKHGAPLPHSLRHDDFGGVLQWALEGRGGAVVRPAFDFVLLCAAVMASLGGFKATLHVSGEAAPLLALPPLVMALFYIRGLYKRRLRTLIIDGILPIVSAVSVAAMSVAVLGVFMNGEIPEQGQWLRAWLFAVAAVAAGRVAFALAQRRARGLRIVGKPVLIVGAGVVGAQVARRLENQPEYGLMPVGFLDEDPRSVAEVGGRQVPVLGTIDELDEMVRRTGVKHLIVAFSSVADARVSRLVQHCQQLGVNVLVVPRMFDTINDRFGYDTVGGLPLLSFRAVDPKGMQFAIKHAFDRVFAALLLVLLAPLIGCLVLAVRLSSPGPVLFSQLRVGRDGKIFNFYKFRSMMAPPQTDDVEQTSPMQYLLAGDMAPGGVEGKDRRTAVGRLMRRTSMDELPQLLNVLRGDMSLVGPRPERPEFVELFRNDIARYGDRHRVKSGITGWAQVHGLRGQTSLAERVELDNYYIVHWSLGLDVKILAMTLQTLLHGAD
jgi:exopolysaccharide biosynthesis polyprenyl glycosylphosphotransferase